MKRSRPLATVSRELLPPVLRRFANRLVRRGVLYSGPYASWASAASESVGYDAASILEAVTAATRSVLAGKGLFEQDGMLFDHPPPPPGPALSGLLLAASLDGGDLRVVDFGGGLGSHFLRWRNWLALLRQVSWSVVEQVHFAETGRRLFGATDLPLRFHESPAEVTSSANAVLASGVLQYLPDPYAALDELSRLDPRVIVIDRTPFARRSDGHVFVQRVTKPLAPASYPLASLSRQRVAETLADRYDLLQSFPSPDSPIDIRGAEADYGGEIWVRRG